MLRRLAKSKRLKRLVDVAAATGGILATAPLMVATAAAIRVSMGRPVLFEQERPGLFGAPFKLRKFRTMRLADEGVADGDRMTRLGRFLRSTSIDELPALWNVLAGDMSMVGPRPLLTRYLPRYSAAQARRHEVLPGLTGLAQVRGRNALSWDEKFALDVWYVENWSVLLDVRILFETVWSVIARRDINAPGHATMPEFMGNDDG